MAEFQLLCLANHSVNFWGLLNKYVDDTLSILLSGNRIIVSIFIESVNYVQREGQKIFTQMCLTFYFSLPRGRVILFKCALIYIYIVAFKSAQQSHKKRKPQLEFMQYLYTYKCMLVSLTFAFKTTHLPPCHKGFCCFMMCTNNPLFVFYRQFC